MNRNAARPHGGLTAEEALAARYALRLCARLPADGSSLPHGVAARLAAARAKAVQAAAPAAVVAPQWRPAWVTAGAGAGRPGSSGGGAWWKFASVLPLLVLVAGLCAISWWQQAERADAAADVDAALLADAVPPDAYADPGFIEFLRRDPREP